MPDKIKFPSDFLWGTATSAYQTEGNNKNTDWWEWEQNKKPGDKFPIDISGKACDSYNRYKEDFNLCKKLNNNAVRISVEWARLEPEQGKFNKNEFEHYKNVLKEAKKQGLVTFVTLHHFTNPKWFSKLGGWKNTDSPKYFSLYAQKCAQEFGNLIDFYISINEPQVYSYMTHFVGTWPPNKTNIFTTFLVQVNFMRAHNKSYKVIKNVNSTHKIGIVKHAVYYINDFSKLNIFGKIFVWLLNFKWTGFYLLPIKSRLDFIGLNYYITEKVNTFNLNKLNHTVRDMGKYREYAGLQKILTRLNKYNTPIYITENGLPTENETKRSIYIKDMLLECSNAIKNGVDLKGYFYWSLLDNYEWSEGYWPKFGLVKVNKKTFKRTPKKTFFYYSNICKNNSLKL